MTTVTSAESPTGHPARRQWIVSFLAFFLIFGAWATAAPYDGPADEMQHVIRAVGVVSGDITPTPVVVMDGQGNPGMGAYQHVPRGLWNHAWCWGFTPKKSAACAPELSGGPITAVPSSAGRYNPVYYAVVGWPLKFAPSWLGLVLSRLISATLSAALLACAFTVLSRWSRHGLMLAGLLAATTPMLAHLAGAINPNGLEIAAGISLFAAGIPLLLGQAKPTHPLIALLGVSAILLVTLRSLGPVWLAFGLAALLLPLNRARLAQLWALPAARRWTAGLVVAGALSVLWIVVMRTGAVVTPSEPLHDYTFSEAAMVYIGNWGNYLSGMVGVAGWFDISMPAPLYWAWISLAASLLVFALTVTRRADRWRYFTLFVGGFMVPGVLQVSQANTVGFIIGGRYMLPLLVAVPLLGAMQVEHRFLTARQTRSFIKISCVVLLPAHLVLLTWSMVRWQSGTDGSHLNPFAGEWLPPSGPYLPVLIMIVGLGLLCGAVLASLPTSTIDVTRLPEGTGIASARLHTLAGESVTAAESTPSVAIDEAAGDSLPKPAGSRSS